MSETGKCDKKRPTPPLRGAPVCDLKEKPPKAERNHTMTDKNTNSKKTEQCPPPMVVTAQANLSGEAAVRVAVVVPWSDAPPRRIQERQKDGVREVLFDVTVKVANWRWLRSAIETARHMVALHRTLVSVGGRRVKRQATPRVADAQQKHEEPRGSTPKPRSGARKRRVEAGGES